MESLQQGLGTWDTPSLEDVHSAGPRNPPRPPAARPVVTPPEGAGSRAPAAGPGSAEVGPAGSPEASLLLRGGPGLPDYLDELMERAPSRERLSSTLDSDSSLVSATERGFSAGDYLTATDGDDPSGTVGAVGGLGPSESARVRDQLDFSPRKRADCFAPLPPRSPEILACPARTPPVVRCPPETLISWPTLQETRLWCAAKRYCQCSSSLSAIRIAACQAVCMLSRDLWSTMSGQVCKALALHHLVNHERDRFGLIEGGARQCKILVTTMTVMLIVITGTLMIMLTII